MNHTISAKEDTKGYISIHLNGRTISYGMTKDEASTYYRGVMTGIEETGHKVILEDSIFDIFHWQLTPKILYLPRHEWLDQLSL